MERDKLLGTMDAKVWTDEFMATKARLGDDEFDHAMMLAWFANAIMAGFDEANRCAQRALDAEREKVAKLEKIQAIDLKNNNEYREQLATLQAQLEALRQERDEARHSRDVFKSQMIAHMNDRDSYAEDLTTLQAQLAAWQTGRMNICLLCGRDKPCMTDEAAIAAGGPGIPCTFDPTPRELFDENKRLKAQLRQVEGALQERKEFIADCDTALDRIQAPRTNEGQEELVSTWRRIELLGKLLYQYRQELERSAPALRAENARLRGLLAEIQYDCEHIGGIQHLDKAERRTWVSVANRIKDALQPKEPSHD